jgi:predicted DNA-binding transcriptional regulator YafY
MQINRLLEIVMILLHKENVTAKELAERFGVSTRTIYRDIDALSLANIPIYTNKGNKGGIRILPEFTLNKSIFSEEEQSEMLNALHNLKAVKYPEIDGVLTKLGALFKNANSYNWLEVDFSSWGSGEEEKNKFNKIKSSILSHKVISFNYINYDGEETKREVEPYKLIFKGQAWYVVGFCRTRSANRTFKISRIRELIIRDEVFDFVDGDRRFIDTSSSKNNMINLIFRFNRKITHRVYDEFKIEDINNKNDEYIEVNTSFAEGEWVYGYILSFGADVEVIEPEYIREEIKNRLSDAVRNYL